MLSYPRLSTAGYPFSDQSYVGLADPAAATAALYANLVSQGARGDLWAWKFGDQAQCSLMCIFVQFWS